MRRQRLADRVAVTQGMANSWAAVEMAEPVRSELKMGKASTMERAALRLPVTAGEDLAASGSTPFQAVCAVPA